MKYKYHFLLIFISIVLIILSDFLLQLSFQNIIFADSKSYIGSAKGIYFYFAGNAYRPMLMSFITGIPFLFGGNDKAIFAFSFWLNLFCWISFFIIQFEIFKSFLTTKLSFVLTLISILFIGNIFTVFHLLTENIFMFMVILAFYFLMKYYQNNNFLNLSIAISLMILSILIKPGMKFFGIIFLIYFIRILYTNYKSKFSIFIYSSLILILIQCAGLKYQFGSFRISYIDAITYYNYIGYKAHCFENESVYDEKPNRLNYIYQKDFDSQLNLASNDLFNQLKNNKINLIKAYWSNFLDNAFSGSLCVSECKNILKTKMFENSKTIINKIIIWQNIIFSFLSIILSIAVFINYKKQQKLIVFIAFFIVYIIGTSAISCSQGNRFHVILFPFSIILLANFYGKILNKN